MYKRQTAEIIQLWEMKLQSTLDLNAIREE